MNKPQKRNQFAKSTILGVIVAGCLFLTVVFTLLPYIDQYDYSHVGMNFAQALIQNNSRLAHRLAVPSQWERIDEWIEDHEPLSCPLSLDGSMAGSVGGPLEEDRAQLSYHETCIEKQYSIEIDIVLQRQNGRWQVVDWSEVQETKK